MDVTNNQKMEDLTEKVLDKLAEYIGQYKIALCSTVNVFYTELQKLGKKVKTNARSKTTSVDNMVNTTAHNLMDWVSEGSIPNIRLSLLIHAVVCSLARTWKDHLLDQTSWYGRLYSDQLEKNIILINNLPILRMLSHEKRWLSLYDLHRSKTEPNLLSVQWDDEKIKAFTRKCIQDWEPELSLRIKNVLRLSEWAWRPHKSDGDRGTPDGITSLEVAGIDRFVQIYLVGCDPKEFMSRIFKIHESIVIHFAQYHTDNPPTPESLSKILNKIKSKFRMQYYQYVAELTTTLGFNGHPDVNSIRDHVEELSFTLEQASTYPKIWDVSSDTLTSSQLNEIYTTLTAERDDNCEWTETDDSEEECSDEEECDEEECDEEEYSSD